MAANGMIPLASPRGHTTATKRDQKTPQDQSEPQSERDHATRSKQCGGGNGGRKGCSTSTCTSTVLIGTHAVIIITDSFIVSSKYRSIRMSCVLAAGH